MNSWIARSAAPIFLFAAALIAPAGQSSPSQPILKPIEIRQISAARGVTWNPNGDMLAVGADDGIYLLNDKLETIHIISNPVETAETVSWSPNGRYLAASGIDHWIKSSVHVWDAQTYQPLSTLRDQTLPIPALAWSPDSLYLASGGWDETLEIWDPLTGQVSRTFAYRPDTSANSAIDEITWSPDGTEIAGFIPDHGIFIWNFHDGEMRLHISGTRAYPPVSLAVAWSPDGRYLFDGYRLLSAKTGAEIREFRQCSYSYIADWHPDSTLIAIYGSEFRDSYNENVAVCDVRTDTIIARLEGGMEGDLFSPSYRYALDWNPDGKRLAGAAGDGFVRIWEVPIPQS